MGNGRKKICKYDSREHLYWQQGHDGLMKGKQFVRRAVEMVKAKIKGYHFFNMAFWGYMMSPLLDMLLIQM